MAIKICCCYLFLLSFFDVNFVDCYLPIRNNNNNKIVASLNDDHEQYSLHIYPLAFRIYLINLKKN